MLKPIGLTEAHMECRSLHETLPVLTALLAFEKVDEKLGEATLKHPNSDWLLTVHEAGHDAPDKLMDNHYGVRVTTNREVDAAYEYLNAHKDTHGLKYVGKPAYIHGSYSLYFTEPGTNGWEIECFEDVLHKGKDLERLGGVRRPQWEQPLPPERFPGRGYVPQAFTHGTLICRDAKMSERFYTNFLGVEIHSANQGALYIKHPASRPYIVCLAARPQQKQYSPNFRFTLTLQSEEAVGSAHRWLADFGEEIGVSELQKIQEDEPGSSFFVSDPDRNWWEIRSPAHEP